MRLISNNLRIVMVVVMSGFILTSCEKESEIIPHTKGNLNKQIQLGGPSRIDQTPVRLNANNIACGAAVAAPLIPGGAI
jgi:hypothetical protein